MGKFQDWQIRREAKRELSGKRKYKIKADMVEKECLYGKDYKI